MMRVRQTFLTCVLSTSAFAACLTLGLGASLYMSELSASAQSAYIPATKGFQPPAACSDVYLGGVDVNIDLGLGSPTLKHVPSPYRGNPEWKAIIVDPNQPFNLQPPTILEGFVSPQPANQTSGDQSTSEVAEEDLFWTHYTHDFTFKVIPDPGYTHLLSSWVNSDGSMGVHTDMEVEWDSASLMDEHEGFQRIWGAVPEFVWPTVGDRAWVSGRWIFDCGHPNSADLRYVQFSSEIHPPRALVTFRLNHPALDSFPFSRISAPSFPAPQSYLPVTGEPITLPFGFIVPNSGPTNVAVTEADIFVSGNGGLASDVCSIVPVPCSAYGGHTASIIPVNDRNYVFDIYPPGTDYLGFDHPRVNGTFGTGPPVPDASLQYRIVDHSSELPAHACGGNDTSGCVTVDPIICLLDSSTPPPNQSETGCPAVPAHPTRLRVILPFAGTNANFFAKSVLLGWDDVPTPANSTPGVRTFKVTLHALTVKHNGVGSFNDGDWRVFVNIGGQYRYISGLFDTDAKNGKGIFQFDGGSNNCNGTALTENANDDCFLFDNTPWTVSVQDGTPIHVAVGGFVARGVEDPNSELKMCRNYPGGCESPTDFDPADEPFYNYGFDNDDRIGTYEFDLNAPDYQWKLPDGSLGSSANPFTTTRADCGVFSLTPCTINYKVEFAVQEVPPATAPVSAPLVIGLPKYTGGAGTYITAATPMIPQTADPTTEGFQYRFHLQGGPLPTYTTTPFPVHWTHADLAPGTHSVEVHISGANAGDGPYDFQYSAESFGNLLEPRHTVPVILDTTPPVITISQPAATSYPHSATLTLGYTVTDAGSGLKSFTPSMDGSLALPNGQSLGNGQVIKLLMSGLSLGPHVFGITAADNIGNSGPRAVPFTIVVTAQSIKDDVTQFLAAGQIKNAGEAKSLLFMLDAAAQSFAAGKCSTANDQYQAFINELNAQSGKGVDATAAQIMIADAHYLMTHCPS